jgi:hypothetical protein
MRDHPATGRVGAPYNVTGLGRAEILTAARKKEGKR